MSTLPIADIVIGDRARRDMGDIQALAESIKEHGLLHPVVVLENNTLVAGGRRLAAVRLLGWEAVPVTVVNVDLLMAERDENEARKDLTPSERVALGRLIEEAERPAAKERIREGAKRARSVQLNAPSIAQPQVRDKAAAAVGMSVPTYFRAKEVVQAAEADPEKFGDLTTMMDSTGTVSGAHEELRRRKAGETARSAVHYRAQYPKPNREMERGLVLLDGLVTGFGLITIEELDRSKTAEWADQLTKASTFLNRLSKKVRALNG